MTINEITLTDGKTVQINTLISLGQLKKFQNDGLISKTFMQDMVAAQSDPSKMSFDDMYNSAYIAYKNKNKDGMDYEDFQDVMPLDLELLGQIYAELINGKVKKHEMAKNFNQHANKQSSKSGKNKGKKYQK